MCDGKCKSCPSKVQITQDRIDELSRQIDRERWAVMFWALIALGFAVTTFGFIVFQ